MQRAVPGDEGEQIACSLIEMLHQGAPADSFARRLVDVEALPDTSANKPRLLEGVRRAMAVRNRLELHQQRESGMLTVIESAQDLSSQLDLASLLHAIVSRARHLFGSHLAWLSIYDEARGEFQVRVTDGAVSRGPDGMVARRQFGVASIVMSTRLPFSTPDYLHDTRFAHDPALDDVFRAEGIAALVGVPLIWKDEVIGLLFVGDRYHRIHAAQSVSILCALATHAAVALKNAREFERANAALERAEQAHAELERHVRSIQAAADAHEMMTSLLAKGAPLSVLCQSVAALLGGAVLVLDEAAQVLSRSTAPGQAGTGADTYVPHGEHSAALARALHASRQKGRSVVAYQAGGETCRVVEVLGGDDVLGSAVLFHPGDLDDIAIRTFERSASVIGIVLLSQERMEASKSRSVATLMRSLVSQRQDEPALLLDQAARHGVDLSQPLALMLVETDGPTAGYVVRRFRATAALPGVLVDEVDGALVLLCAASHAPDVQLAVSDWARRTFGPVHRGVVSRPTAGLVEVPVLYATLRRALAVLGRLGVKGRIVGQNELALYSALFETHDQASLASYLEATLGALLSHDQKRGSDLASTLLCYFDCNQNATLAAQRLGIHVNTVRQRLAATEDVLGHWGNASRALEIHIALRLWRLRTPAA